MSITEGEETMTVSGSMAYLELAASASLTANLKVTDSAGTLELKNYVMAWADTAEGEEMTVTGRIISSQYGGYVDITTETPFTVNYLVSVNPMEGVLVVHGKDNTAARLRVDNVDYLGYYVEADTDGDGEFDDYSSGLIYWDTYVD